MAVKKKQIKAAADGLGVAELAKHLGIEQATVRVKLRKAKVKKSGGVYSWPTQAALKKVAQQIGAE